MAQPWACRRGAAAGCGRSIATCLSPRLGVRDQPSTPFKHIVAGPLSLRASRGQPGMLCSTPATGKPLRLAPWAALDGETAARQSPRLQIGHHHTRCHVRCGSPSRTGEGKTPSPPGAAGGLESVDVLFHGAGQGPVGCASAVRTPCGSISRLTWPPRSCPWPQSSLRCCGEGRREAGQGRDCPRPAITSQQSRNGPPSLRM